MTSAERRLSLRSAGGLLALSAILLSGFFLSCNLAGEEGGAYMQVAYDTTWDRYDTVVIAWKDTVTGKVGTFYRGTPADLKANSRVPAEGYDGQEIVITVHGIEDGEVAFEEVRHYKASNPDAVVKLVTKPYVPVPPDTTKPIKPDTTKPVLPDTTRPVLPDTTKPVKPDTTRPVLPDTAKPVLPDTTKPIKPGPDSLPARSPARPALAPEKVPDSVSIGDTVAFSVKATLDSGSLARYAWDFQGDGVTDDSGSLSGNSATLAARRAYPDAGNFSAVLKIYSAADSMARSAIPVRVVRDAPVVSAGPDTTVYLGTRALLRGSARDGFGRIVKTEWKIGNAAFAAAPADTGFTAPDVEGDVACVLRATDDDGLIGLDTVVVHVISKSESNLTGISVSRGELSPQFNPAVLAYADTVPFNVSSVAVTAFGEGALTIQGAAAVSGQPSLAFDLPVGSTEVTLTVRREGSNPKAYRIAFVRLPASGNADLSGLSVSAGALDSVFSPSDTAYLVKVGNGVATTTVTAVIAGPYASLKLNGTDIASGTASAPIHLAVGETPLLLEITAQNGTKKAYRVRVVRAANGNSALAGMTCSLGALTPAFFAATYEYSLAAENSDSVAIVGATTAVPTTSLTINGQPAVSGVGISITLPIGINRIPVVATSQSGAKTTYVLTITRARNGNADLAQLETSAGTLVPAFSPSVTSYRVTLGNAITSLTLRPVNASGTAVDSVDGKAVASGSHSAPIPLSVGDNTIAVKVTAQNGAQKTYTVVATRAGSGNALLSGISIAGTAIPGFHPDTLSYTFPIANAFTSAVVSATVADPTASYAVTPSSNVLLKTGSNPVRIEVAAQDGTRRAYVVDIVRAKNGNARLSGLITDAGPLAPTFSADVQEYAVTVPHTVTSATVRPTIQAATSTMTVNGSPLASNVTSPPTTLQVGANVVPIIVTAEDGTVRNYSLTVTREKSADASLSSLEVFGYTAGGASSALPLDVPFLPGTLAYATAPTAGAVKARVKLTSAQAEAVIRVNGFVVPSGQESQDIVFQADSPASASISVTAPDGKSGRTYNLRIARPQDVGFLSTYNNLLKSFDAGATWTSVGTTTPIFIQAIHFFDAYTGIAAGDAEIFKTIDGGKTWVKKATAKSDWGRTTDIIRFLDDKTGYVVAYMEVLKTTDGGETWTSIHDYGGGIHSAHFFDADRAILGVIGGSFHRTSDGGKTWQVANGPNPGTVKHMDFLTPLHGVMTMSWNTTLRTRDGGTTFDTIAVFPGETHMEAVEVLDENTVIMGGQNLTLMKTKDGGKTWVEKLGGGSEHHWIQSIRFRSANVGYALTVNGAGVYQTLDAGETWTKMALPSNTYSSIFFLP